MSKRTNAFSYQLISGFSLVRPENLHALSAILKSAGWTVLRSFNGFSRLFRLCELFLDAISRESSKLKQLLFFSEATIEVIFKCVQHRTLFYFFFFFSFNVDFFLSIFHHRRKVGLRIMFKI